MITIKFRVWDTANKEFLSDREDWCWNILKDLNDQLYDRYIVEQFTGLKDMNGKEIFEGDILERVGDGVFTKIVVSWDDKRCRFVTKNIYNLHNDGADLTDYNTNICDWTYWVVCGNIRETPELLKQ